MLFYLTCIYISFYFIRPAEWIPGLIDVPIFNVLGIVSVIIIWLLTLSGEIRLLCGEEEKTMTWFIMAIILSHASHTYLQGVIDSLNNALPIIVGFFLMSSSIKSKSRYDNFILLMIALTTFLAYEGTLQYRTGFAHGGATPIVTNIQTVDGGFAETIRIRWYGIFGDPNDLGLILVVAVPFLVNMVLNKQFFLPIACLPLVSYAIYHTNSRGSYLAFLSSVLAYFVIRYRNKIGLAIGLALAGIIFALGPTRMVGITSAEESIQGRLEAWYAGFQMFKANPLFGLGQNMFMEYHNLTSHNSYVHILAELGFFGLFCFTGLIYFPLSWLWRNLFQNQTVIFSREDLGRLSAVFSSLLGMLMAMFFLSRSYVLIPFILFVLATASTRLCIPISGALAEPLPVKQHYINIAIATVLVIIFIKLMTMSFIM